MDDEWEPPLPAGYNDTNRAFIQAFMARGTLTFPEAQKILAEIKAVANGQHVDVRSITMADFENYVRTAREAVSTLDYDILSMKHQSGGERVWAFINAHSDPSTQIATTLTPEEVACFKRLLDAMFDEYNTPRMEVMAIDEAQALKVSRPPRRGSTAAGHADGGGDGDDAGEGSSAAPQDRGLKHSEVLALLSNLVASGWLEKSHGGFYGLSPKSLMELMSWLMATYNDPDSDEEWQRIKFCEACKEILTYGQRCSERDCTVRLHDICTDAFWRLHKDKKCPKCHTEWDGKHFVGERAVTSRSAFQKGRRGRRGGRQSERVAEDDEAED